MMARMSEASSSTLSDLSVDQSNPRAHEISSQLRTLAERVIIVKTRTRKWTLSLEVPATGTAAELSTVPIPEGLALWDVEDADGTELVRGA